MAFDGLVTRAVTRELASVLPGSKIEKIYQPEAEVLILNLHTKQGNKKLLLSCEPSGARVHFAETTYENPEQPLSFCMLLRKHLSAGRIVDVFQKETERIVEFEIEAINELGFSFTRRLIVEIMGKHSNIVLTDGESYKIIDAIKRVSADVNRVRQILPGFVYQYPPAQEGKKPFDDFTNADWAELTSEPDPEYREKRILDSVQGVSPGLAAELALRADRFKPEIPESCNVYLNPDGSPKDFHVFRLSTLEANFETLYFKTASEGIEYFYLHKAGSNRLKQKSNDLSRSVKASLEKLYLKKQRLSEDLLRAENSEDLRLYGELLTANLHNVQPGAASARVLNYYTGEEIEIPLDKRFSASKNAQLYYKRYGKSKTAIKEKALQIEDCEANIAYLESALTFTENADSVEEIEAIRSELTESGYLRSRKNNFKVRKAKPQPLRFETSDGLRVLVGRNNVENDLLTFKTAGKNDIWFHVKDIPGSHVVLFTEGLPLEKISEAAIFETAAIAAYYSKGRAGENVPVDYVQARYVKKPAGAKPGMVIFTNNRTVWVNPRDPFSTD